MTSIDLPALDCHAHISPDVSADQIRELRNSVVFAVARSLDESERVVSRPDDEGLIWGCGVHPGVPEALASFDATRLVRLLGRFALVGEIGLDRRAGNIHDQSRVLRVILRVVASAPVLVSLHSAGCEDQLLAMLQESPHAGAILHWFTGDESAVRKATEMGCYFSVNGAMPDDVLARIPFERMLPETDFPATKRQGGGKAPGDTLSLETRVGKMRGESAESIRRHFYRNLRSIALASGAIERLPEPIADRLLSI